MQMEEMIPVQVTEKGILIPHEALGELDRVEIEVVRDKDQIVIRPKPQLVDERGRIAQILRDAGLLYEPDWEQPPPVSPQERARLAQKLASTPPLSEVIIADREDRV
jgi:bifunctional DNA-binding transcriptional regulator/antitoxin component of YhaV-PrlF toxin-antitoxin module